ncbi:DUF4179 domain-containing protein [Sporosarcina sp. BI001-red]|uniref:DUF4179 domain-containing protein n=1 Tax=Sporosarcina sp. BI001-red TaxID=2282866 RepID=UPI000E260426|nr:DUF4179 domain-containing protein [Sporosarcina sp. BI001-red]REB05239.1 DUF4179 domain-containing protein [Sporosarcina sp. BI001-red]
MSEIENQLKKEKERLDEVKAPDELNERLRKALEQTPPRRKNKAPKWLAVAAALIALTFVSYNYNAFAYYGKKLLGYDELMTETLAQLNEQGSGQAIEKKVMLSDGTELYLDGLLTDENQTILYYTVKNSKGLLEDTRFDVIRGVWTKAFATYGTFSMNEDGTEVKGIQGFDAVSPFAKELTLEFSYNESSEQREITFPYNPKQAMQTELKQSIHKKVHVDQGTIRFDSITATPSRTTIKGKVNVDNFDRIDLGVMGIQLLADGKPIDWTGGSSKSALFGQDIEIYYDRLPKEVNTLEIDVDKFVGYQKLNETIALTGETEQTEKIFGKELLIRKVEKTTEGIQVTLATDQNVLLDGVSIQSKGNSTPLHTTLRSDILERENGELNNERVLLFKSDELPETLSIEGMHYAKSYGNHIQLIGKKEKR